MKNLIKSVRGMPDIAPPQSSLWAQVEKCAREVFSFYGFEELRTPILEPVELFVRGVGENTAIVEKEMYTLTDKSENKLAMRPEGTASIVKSYIANIDSNDPLARYYYIGPMFRYERPQKGRQRQFHQIGVELLGVETPHADAEVIVMLTHLLKELGIEDWKLKINSLGCDDCRPTFQKQFFAFLKDKVAKDLCPDCQRRMGKNPLRVLDCKNSDCQKLLVDAPTIGDFWCEKCVTHFDSLKSILSAVGVLYEVETRIVRGLDYYVRTAFEFVSGALGAQDAIAGGGRYDGLVKALGGPDVAGVGWALGLERLMLILESLNLSKPKTKPFIYFALIGEKSLQAVLPIIQRIRRDGVCVEWDYMQRSLKSQMRRADKLGAQTVVIIGDEELSKGMAIVRDMHSKQQREVLIKDLPMHFVDIEM
ncbi:MAG: histidine--tRNA ligase [Pseudomonadota bacterium]